MAGVYKKVVETYNGMVAEKTLSFESFDDFMAYEDRSNPEVLNNISFSNGSQVNFSEFEDSYPETLKGLSEDGSITLTLTEDEAYTLQVLCGLTADKDANRVLGKIEDLTGYECSLYDYDRTVLTDEDGSVEIKFVN